MSFSSAVASGLTGSNLVRLVVAQLAAADGDLGRADVKPLASDLAPRRVEPPSRRAPPADE